MTKSLIRLREREKLSPRIWESGYLVLRHILSALLDFSRAVERGGAKRILDLGCGMKPYRKLFLFSEEFIGFDIEKTEATDVVGLNWNLPFEDSRFDALLCTQVLEHTARISDTVAEIRRVVKDDGFVFVSAPLAYPEHGAPFDYYRFTRYGLEHIFEGFEIVQVYPQGGYLNTLLRLVNVFFEYVPYARFFLFPLFFLNNILALFFDAVFNSLGTLKVGRPFRSVYFGFPENYAMILRNKKWKNTKNDL